MKVFRMSPFVHGRSRMDDFLRDCFVSIGHPGIGDPEQTGEAEVSKRLNRVYGYEGSELGRRLGEIATFVRGMADGDYVVIPHGSHVWLGDLGDYYYRDDYDRPEEATCHRRGVTWLGVLPREALNPLLLGFLSDDADEGAEGSPARRFPFPAEYAGLEVFAAQAPGGTLPGWPSAPAVPATGVKLGSEADSPAGEALGVDAETLREAVSVLREALRGDDPALRVRAAEALLRYAK